MPTWIRKAAWISSSCAGCAKTFKVFSPGSSSNLFSLEFTSTSSRDRMYPKLFIIYPLLDSVYSIFVSISTCCRNHQKVMLEFVRPERVLYRKHIVSVQTLITYKALILSGWQRLKDSPLWWHDENAVFEAVARCEEMSWGVSRRGSLKFSGADFVSDWKAQFVKD